MKREVTRPVLTRPTLARKTVSSDIASMQKLSRSSAYNFSKVIFETADRE